MKKHRSWVFMGLVALLSLSSNASATFTIAIAGGSRSGKTTTARLLAKRISEKTGSTATYLSQDMYFSPGEQPQEKWRFYSYGNRWDHYPNFDDPSAMDWLLMNENLNAMREGKAFRPPVYYFGTGQNRVKDQGEEINQPDFLIFEGIHALNEKIQNYFDLKVFINTPESVRTQRVSHLGLIERRQSEQDTASYAPILEEAYLNHIEPTIQNADLIIKGLGDIEANVTEIMNKIEDLGTKEIFSRRNALESI